MSALARSIDVGFERTRDVPVIWSVGDREFAVVHRVTFRVDFPSIRHRRLGLEPRVMLMDVRVEIAGDWRPALLNSRQREALVDEIEAEEELNAPMSGD